MFSEKYGWIWTSEEFLSISLFRFNDILTFKRKYTISIFELHNILILTLTIQTYNNLKNEKEKKRQLEIGDHVKETSIARTGRRRIGEIISILSDSKSDPTIECIRICPKELTALEGGNGEIKRFKSKDEAN